MIAVIGGGMAGLGAAHALESARAAAGTEPFDWVLFERADYFGGKVRTERVDGFVIEGGPDSFIVEKPWPMELARKLGIDDRLLDSNEDVRRSYVFSRGRLHELPEGLILMVPTRLLPFAASSLITLRGKLRMGLDLVLPRGTAVADESLGDFVRRRLGAEALAKVAEPIVAGIHAGDPEQMSVRATFPMFLEMERDHRSLIVGMIRRRRARLRAAAARAGGSGTGGAAGTAGVGSVAGAADASRKPRAYFLSFRTGLADLADAIVADLPPERLRGGIAVESLAAEPAADAAGSAYRLRLSDGSEQVVQAVVLAGPAFAAAELLGGMAAIIGAFLAGLFFARTPEKGLIDQGVNALAYGLFVPVFFIDIGLGVDLRGLPVGAFGLILVVTLAAVAGKLLGAAGGARLAGLPGREAFQLGAGMVARGEVTLIVAAMGSRSGLIGGSAFSALVAAVLLSTLATPPLLRFMLTRPKTARPVQSEPEEEEK